MSKLTLVNGQNVDFSLDAQTSGTGTMKTPDLAGATKYQVPAASAAAAAEIAKLGVHGADIASASTTNLETATGELVDVTGTTTITAITLSDGHRRIVRFTGALTLTHGASLVLPGAANIVTAAGDVAVFEGYASSVVRCVGYMRAAVAPGEPAVVRGTDLVFTSNTTLADVLSVPVLANSKYHIEFHINVLSSGGASGAKLALTFPGSTTQIDVGEHGTVSTLGGGPAVLVNSFADFPNSVGPSGSEFESDADYTSITLVLHVDVITTTAGSIAVQGAQATSSASPTTFRKTSFATIQKLS
jgi:hypothetical protein